MLLDHKHAELHTLESSLLCSYHSHGICYQPPLDTGKWIRKIFGLSLCDSLDRNSTLFTVIVV